MMFLVDFAKVKNLPCEFSSQLPLALCENNCTADGVLFDFGNNIIFEPFFSTASILKKPLFKFTAITFVISNFNSDGVSIFISS